MTAVLAETVKLLGLSHRPVHNVVDVLDLIRKGLPASAIARVSESLDLSVKTTTELLGLAPRTIARRIERKMPLGPKESEVVVRLARVFAQAEDVLGSRDKARAWLKKPNRALGGHVPLSLLDTDLGAGTVIDVLGRIDYGVLG
jgi:putative toxin-antitoxin system antitoxin component (TIGR02293 family)